MTLDIEEIRRAAQALCASVDATLARERPPAEQRWAGMPPADVPAPAKAAPQDPMAAMMDTIAQGVGMSIREATQPLYDRIRELEDRLAAMENRNE